MNQFKTIDVSNLSFPQTIEDLAKLAEVIKYIGETMAVQSVQFDEFEMHSTAILYLHDMFRTLNDEMVAHPNWEQFKAEQLAKKRGADNARRQAANDAALAQAIVDGDMQVTYE